MWRKWQGLTLWVRVLTGLTLGVIAGLVFNLLDVPQYAENIRPIGTLFLNAIKMLMVPIIFFSLTSGIMSVSDPAKMGRVGIKTISWFFGTTAFAVTIGLLIANLIGPGVGAILPGADADAAPSLSLTEILVGLVPANPVAAFASANVLQIIVFSLLIGICVNLVGEKAAPVRHFIDAGAEIMYKLTHLVMELAPYGVFALIAWVVGIYGLETLKGLSLVILSAAIASALHMAVTYGGILVFYARLNPKRFFGGVLDAMMVSFSTASSAGTLPVTLANVQDNLGVSKGISSFVLPLGSTMNMNGTAIYLGTGVVFTAQAMGVDLGLSQYIVIILTTTLAAIGAASVPAAGLIMLPVVLGAAELSLGTVALFAGIDRILDMIRTMTNVTGDALIATLVAQSEGELDLETYNAPPVE